MQYDTAELVKLCLKKPDTIFENINTGRLVKMVDNRLFDLTKKLQWYYPVVVTKEFLESKWRIYEL